MAKYRRSARGGSFRPEQVSGQGEARLQEYANRIINGLRDEQEAVISNRNTIADAMKENAEIESKQASTNAKIEQQNLQSKLDAIQAQSAAAMQQFEIDTKASGEIFKNISNLSLTAGKKLQEIEIERLHQKWKNDQAEVLLLGNNHPAVKALDGLIKEQNTLLVQGQAQVYEAQQNGANPLEVSKLSEMLRTMSYGAKLGVYGLIGKKYPSFLREKFLDDTQVYTDSQGNQFKGNEAARDPERTNIVIAAAYDQFLELSELKGTNPALLQKSGLLDSMMLTHQQAIRTAEKGKIEDNDTKADYEYTSGYANQPDTASRKNFIETNWIPMVTRKGFKGALDFLTESAKQTDENGIPINEPDALFSAVIGPNGKTFEESFPTRVAEIRKALVNAKSQAFRMEEENNRQNAILDFRAVESDLIAQLAAAPPSEDLNILATAIAESRKRNNGQVARQLLDLQQANLAQNKQEAEAKFAAIQDLARAGMLKQGDVLGISDPTLRAQAQELLNTQNKTSKFGPDYQAVLKGLAGDARKIAGDSLEGASSSSAQTVKLFMERQFAAWYKEGLARNNNDPTAALSHANKKHQKELAASLAGEGTGLYVRKLGENNAATYPNIEKTRRKTQAQTDANLARIENLVGTIGAGALNSPGLVMGEQSLRNLSQTHYTGGSIGQLITPEVKRSAQLLGVSEMEVINRQIDAYNKINTDKIERIESPTLDLVNDARPETRQLFTNLPTRASVYRGAATIGGTLNNNVRSTFSRSVNSFGNPTASDQFIVSIGINEGTRTADGGTTAAYARHTDPGDKGLNRGTFSYDPARFGTDPNMTPEEADAAYMPNLVAANNKYAPILKQMGYVEGTKEYGVAMFNILDLTVQAPAAVDDFVNVGLRNLAGLPLTKENVGDARAYAFYNPRTGQLEAGGFDNDFERLRADQRARSMTILTGQRN